MGKGKGEFKRFGEALDRILSITHNQIKSQLEQEQEDKKRKKAKKSSASRESNAKA